MLKIGICDDDIHMLTYLSGLCARILPEAGTYKFRYGRDLLDSGEEFDIILMDVEMKDMDGLEVVKLIQQRSLPDVFRKPAVIFITAYENYVFDALDLFAFHYMLKPLDEEKFEKVLRKAATECSRAEKENALFFHTKSSHIRLYPSQITYIESNLRKVIIHTGQEPIELYSTMADLEQVLGQGFYRCHRAYLVNLGKIKRYDKQSIQLTDGTTVLLSKLKYTEFVEGYMRFLKQE